MRGQCPRDDLSPNVTRAFLRIARCIQRGRMFPDVRLMVAATFASVVALMFGFGLFAALRVSHEPLGRVQLASAPVQLVADNAAIAEATIVPWEPFDRRFQIVDAPMVSETASTPAPGPDLQDDIETSSVALQTASTARSAAALDGTSAVGEPNDQPTLPAVQPADAPVVATAATASDQPAAAPRAESATTAAADAQDNAVSAPAINTAAVEQQSKSDVAPAVNTEPTAAPSVAAVSPGKDWRQDWARPPPAAQRPNANAATAAPRKRVARVARPTIEKRARLARVAVLPRRPRRIPTTVAVRTIDQNNGFERSNFQSGPQAQAQPVPRHVVRIRHAYVAPDRLKERTSAVGGPYVSP
jgi:hypothetical protein